ncbi:hypothetical protein E4U39_002600 [Claviceps sp. Clav50 group G5]|nr:hypothetical protein E4U39_002600 [Claviceps sp. Clav50 group G5]
MVWNWTGESQKICTPEWSTGPYSQIAEWKRGDVTVNFDNLMETSQLNVMMCASRTFMQNNTPHPVFTRKWSVSNSPYDGTLENPDDMYGPILEPFKETIPHEGTTHY